MKAFLLYKCQHCGGIIQEGPFEVHEPNLLIVLPCLDGIIRQEIWRECCSDYRDGKVSRIWARYEWVGAKEFIE